MAKIDTSTIEGYDNMTAEQKLAALEGFEYDDGSDEIQRLKSANTKASKEAAEWKRKHNELLSEEEKKKQDDAEEHQKLVDRVAELEKEKAIAGHKANFIAMGYDEKLAEETAQAMADGDTDKVFANQKKFLAAHDKAYKAELMKNPSLEPDGGEPPAPKTKEEIMKIKDAQERQQAIMDNPELFGLKLE